MSHLNLNKILNGLNSGLNKHRETQQQLKEKTYKTLQKLRNPNKKDLSEKKRERLRAFSKIAEKTSKASLNLQLISALTLYSIAVMNLNESTNKVLRKRSHINISCIPFR